MPCYCEENVWHLLQEPTLFGDRPTVLFLSNPHRSCAVWSQQAADPGQPVVWDYHVVLATYQEGWQVWDLDSRLPFPAGAEQYLQHSFPLGDRVAPRFAPRFRLVPGSVYRARLASDRSHMRTPEGEWLAPPPPWPPIGAGQSNLQRFIDMERPFVGEVLPLTGLRRRLSDQPC